jgi:hypothetical protein
MVFIKPSGTAEVVVDIETIGNTLDDILNAIEALPDNTADITTIKNDVALIKAAVVT